MSDATRTIRSLGELRALGATLSVDDFGTGYSSLAYLHRFPVDELKIDRAFIKDIGLHHEQRTLASAIAAMGNELGLRVVAEGVETEDELEHVRAIGCEQAQGFYLGRPSAPDSDVLRAALRSAVTPHAR